MLKSKLQGVVATVRADLHHFVKSALPIGAVAVGVGVMSHHVVHQWFIALCLAVTAGVVLHDIIRKVSPSSIAWTAAYGIYVTWLTFHVHPLPLFTSIIVGGWLVSRYRRCDSKVTLDDVRKSANLHHTGKVALLLGILTIGIYVMHPHHVAANIFIACVCGVCAAGIIHDLFTFNKTGTDIVATLELAAYGVFLAWLPFHALPLPLFVTAIGFGALVVHHRLSQESRARIAA